jgi:hypothetical protein
MKKQLIELNQLQASIVLEQLDQFCRENKEIEQEFGTSNEDRKALREERIEAEMLIKQIEALEWK